MIWFKLWRDSRKHALGGLGIVLGIALLHGVLAPAGLSIFGVDPSKLPRFPLVLSALPKPEAPSFASSAWWLMYLNAAVLIGPLLGIITAGSGIAAQCAGWSWRGSHPSVIYTLSLPVTRLRWAAARAALGLAQMSVLVLLLVMIPAALSPFTGGHFSWQSALAPFVFLLLGSGVFYALSMFLATFLDETWQTLSSGAMLAALALLASSGVNRRIFEFMSGLYPSMSGALVCIALMAVLFRCSVWIIERREF